MPTAAEYFSKVTYKPKYFLGDRVRGFYHGIPFAGTVSVDTKLDVDVDPYVVVICDLPIKHEDYWHTIIKVTHDDLIDIREKYDINRKTTNK